VILDVSNPNTPVMYVSNSVDVTREIIDLYDKMITVPNAPSGAAPPKPTAPKPALTPAAPPAPVTPLQRPHAPASADPGRPQQRTQTARPLGAHDANGRPLPRSPVSEDDHLDIPAFLRRQQN